MPRGLYNPYEHAAGPSRSTARQTTDINAARSHAYQYPSPVDSNSSRGRMDYGLGNTPGQARSSRSGSTTTPPELGRNELASHFPVHQSMRYPDLHFLLANDLAGLNRFYYDLRRTPRDGILSDVFELYGSLWAMRSRPGDIRIVSREFPWIIDIKANPAPENEGGVTCGDIWISLYQELLKPLTDADWALLTALADLGDEKTIQRLTHLTNITRRQVERGEQISLRRLDWLMRKTLFIGLTKDDESRLCQRYILPGSALVSETWVAEFQERP